MPFAQKYLRLFVRYLLVAVAMVSVSVTNETWAATDHMESVLYFKNGNVIRGVIVEQVLGESLKIQTREGNILKFQVDEIEKIITERLTQQSLKAGCLRFMVFGPQPVSRKSPALALGISLGAGIFLDGYGQFYNEEYGKGALFIGWSLLSTWLFLEGQDDDEIAVGALSALACRIYAARDAYRSTKRINAERGYANLSEKVIPKKPTINLGMRGRGNMFLALNHTF